MITRSEFKLGMTKPTVPENLPTVNGFKAFTVRQAPAVLKRSDDPGCGMYDNDRIGDCTAVGIANLMNAASVATTRTKIAISTKRVITFYSKSAGYDPNDPRTDRGADPTAVLKYLMTRGFDADYWNFTGIFGTVDPADRNALANTMLECGGVYGAFALTDSDRILVGNRQVLDINGPGDSTLWSWGGHLAIPYDYSGLKDTDTVRLITWNMLYPTTWRWIRSRMVMSYAVLFRQLMGASQHNSLGEDWDTMLAQAKTFATMQ